MMDYSATERVDKDRSFDDVRVQLLQNSPGEGSCHYQEEHALFISLASRPVRYLQAQAGKTHTGVYRQGDILITPVNTPLFVRWEDRENCLEVKLNSQLIKTIAEQTLDCNPDRLQLLPAFQIRDSQLETISTMLLAEFQQENSNNKLYLDSLTNVLIVNLLRNHTVSKPQLPIYEGGLSPRQLSQVLDYIDAYLDKNIKLADLSKLLDMSAFHFSRLFKQSIGMTPHKYLLQQRVERAKKLLNKTDRLIIDIALECGFSSHSHFGKHFRQFTGTTPQAYRTNNNFSSVKSE